MRFLLVIVFLSFTVHAGLLDDVKKKATDAATSGKAGSTLSQFTGGGQSPTTADEKSAWNAGQDTISKSLATMKQRCGKAFSAQQQYQVPMSTWTKDKVYANTNPECVSNPKVRALGCANLGTWCGQALDSFWYNFCDGGKVTFAAMNKISQVTCKGVANGKDLAPKIEMSGSTMTITMAPNSSNISSTVYDYVHAMQ